VSSQYTIDTGTIPTAFTSSKKRRSENWSPSCRARSAIVSSISRPPVT
jgi:hypothetical protein